MNPTQIKILPVLLVLAILGFGPLSITCLIGMSVVIGRPRWFYRLTQDLYRNPAPVSTAGGHPGGPLPPALGVRLLAFLGLLLLLVLDIAPVPVAGTLAIYIVLTRPAWFLRLVRGIYRGITP